MQVFRGPAKAVSSLDFSPDGSRLAAGCDDGSVWLFDLFGDRVLTLYPARREWVRGVVAKFAPDGRHIVTAAAAAAELWDVADGRLVKSLAGPDGYVRARGVGFHRDRLLLPLHAPDVPAFDARSFEPLPPALRAGAVPWGTRAFAIEPGGHRTALAEGGLIDLDAGVPCGQWRPYTPGVNLLAWCPGRPFLAAATASVPVVIYDADAGAQVATLAAPTNKATHGLAFAPDGRSLLAASNDGIVRVYDTETWGERAAYDWRIGQLRSLAVSPDGTRAAVGAKLPGHGGGVVVWDVE